MYDIKMAYNLGVMVPHKQKEERGCGKLQTSVCYLELEDLQIECELHTYDKSVIYLSFT